MDILELAIRARVPCIHCTTDDLVHVEKVVSWIAGSPVGMLQSLVGGEFNSPQEVLLSNGEVTAEIWSAAKAKGKCIVFVNTKPSPLHFKAGMMLPPKAMVAEWLPKNYPDCDGDVIDSLGGLTLKEIFELLKLTKKEFGSPIKVRNINTVRQSYVSKLRGLSLIDSTQGFYQVPHPLEQWMGTNKALFTEHKHPRLTPRGVLLDGPPGTGKTEAAKYIAQEFNVPLYRMDIAGMKGKYVGDSEGALAAALAQLDQAAPCVVLIDEAEKAMSSNHGSSGDHVGTSMLGNLLWWLQSHKSRVFTVMTTNKKDALPPELYREGRIDCTMLLDGLHSYADVAEFAVRVLMDVTDDGDGGSILSTTQMDKLQTRISEETPMKAKLPAAQASVVKWVEDLVKETLAEDQ